MLLKPVAFRHFLATALALKILWFLFSLLEPLFPSRRLESPRFYRVSLEVKFIFHPMLQTLRRLHTIPAPFHLLVKHNFFALFFGSLVHYSIKAVAKGCPWDIFLRFILLSQCLYFPT